MQKFSIKQETPISRQILRIGVLFQAAEQLAGLNEMPAPAVAAQSIGGQILTRAALSVMRQMGMLDGSSAMDDGVEKPKVIDGGRARRVVEEEEPKTVSPMCMEEFRNILQNGVSTGSPCSPRRRASLMAELVGPVPRLELESKFVEPAAPPRKSIPGFMAAPKFASTPKPDGIRRSMVDGSLPTPRRGSLVKQQRAPAIGDVTPMENKASRLRRLKLEETRKSMTGGGGGSGKELNLDISLNSSCGWK
ncbi:uncharacterized protein CELE_Y54G2A.5 [Caenorhabditis elegans]|uniref:Yeast DiM Like n=2 Tax=Caenorhabditis elegans TaxID=6239 RepID=Q8WTL0_CAEEL|nr:uncharacterized protein CELE_Y54G2A.5 [Caenorhabditis elegans]CCD83491.2 yeast DiM Like [Caenorhabditis elegans]|eukprot:NP_001023505.2 yeast DiM Like [Caenorhabditis elegans]